MATICFVARQSAAGWALRGLVWRWFVWEWEWRVKSSDSVLNRNIWSNYSAAESSGWGWGAACYRDFSVGSPPGHRRVSDRRFWPDDRWWPTSADQWRSKTVRGTGRGDSETLRCKHWWKVAELWGDAKVVAVSSLACWHSCPSIKNRPEAPSSILISCFNHSAV